MRLKPIELETLKLISRSKPEANGWILCSEIFWPLVQDLPEELCESFSRNDFRYARLTEEAKIILKWIA